MRKVSRAFLHNTLSIPGLSNDCGKELSDNAQSKLSSVTPCELWWDTEGLIVKITDRSMRKRSILVPSSNVSSVEFKSLETVETGPKNVA